MEPKSDVDLEGNLLNVAPYEGSISWLKYKTDTRRLFTFDVQTAEGGQLPFGAVVSGAGNEEVGYVAQGSQIFIKSETLPASLKVNISKGKTKNSALFPSLQSMLKIFVANSVYSANRINHEKIILSYGYGHNTDRNPNIICTSTVAGSVSRCNRRYLP